MSGELQEFVVQWPVHTAQDGERRGGISVYRQNILQNQ
jgi:hypothetical protein